MINFVNMRFVIIGLTLVFSLLTLAPNLQGAELLKIGDMLHHYKAHHQGDGKNSFSDFLVEHYGKPIDPNEKEHRNLPFKTTNSTFVQLTICEFQIQAVLEEVFFVFDQKGSFSDPQFIDSAKLAAIWNPPRV